MARPFPRRVTTWIQTCILSQNLTRDTSRGAIDDLRHATFLPSCGLLPPHTRLHSPGTGNIGRLPARARPARQSPGLGGEYTGADELDRQLGTFLVPEDGQGRHGVCA